MDRKTGPKKTKAEITSDNDRISLSGRLDSFGTADVWNKAMELASGSTDVVLDASDVDYLDGSGAALVTKMEEVRSSQGGSLRVEGLTEDFQSLLEMYREETKERPEPEHPHRLIFVEQVGRKGITVYRNFLNLLEFLGESVLALGSSLIHPRRVRWKDTFAIAENAGINALPIVILIGFLIGLTIAFQSSIQLRKFGAELYIADMLGLAMFREMGPMTTAILLAGRSGSAFAAEIGTMTVNDEIKALRAMGISPVRFLAVSRMIAAIAISPVLMMIFNFFSFVGGAV
ncbi:MAG: ABC transporter permease, partial [Desulfovibrionales bacterium]